MTGPIERKQAARALIVRRLLAMAPRQRAAAMVEEVDGKALVRSLPAEDVYASILDVGLSDAQEIVQLASPKQFRTFIDLAAWQKDRFDPLELVRWLEAVRGESDEDYLAALARLDIELLELVFIKLSTIHDLESDPDADGPGVTWQTPEGKLLVEFNVEGQELATLMRLLKDLETHNAFQVARFLEAVRHELPSELEEAAFRLRSARLEELGFPPLEEAMKLFAWVNPDTVSPQGKGAPALAPTGGSVDFVEAAFKHLDADERENLAAEVRYLVNAALVAEGAEPGDPPSIRRISEHARDYLNLGLEHLCGGDPEHAVEVVRKDPLRKSFQIGFSLTLKLRREAEHLREEPGVYSGETILALEEETAALKALLRRRPLRALRVAGAEPVAFRSKRELAEVAAVLARVRRQAPAFGVMLGAAPEAAVAPFLCSLAELTPQRFLVAALAWGDLDGVARAAPVPEARLVELCERWFEGGAVRTTAGERTLAVWGPKLGEHADAFADMARRALAVVAQELAASYEREGRVSASRVMSIPVEGQLPI